MEANKAIDLDAPLIEFGTGNSPFTIRHCVENIAVFGGLGSGKTSSVAKLISSKMLGQNFGGLVLTCKKSEIENWKRLCAENGRTKDLCIIGPGYEHRFNFLEYISKTSDSNIAITENIVDVLKTVINAGEEKGGGHGEDGFFWVGAMDQLMCQTVDLCMLAYGHATVDRLYDIVQSLPQSNERPKTVGHESPKEHGKAFDTAYNIAAKKISDLVAQWKRSVPKEEIEKIKDQQAFDSAVNEAIPEARLFNYVAEFFYGSFRELSPKTRSIVLFIFSNFLYRLLRDPVYSLFCNKTSTVIPEDCFNGKIILIALPLKQYHRVGRDCQLMIKYLWSLSMEKREITSSSTPCFLFVDEAQSLLHEHDNEFLATARESRICTVYISQNLPNYYAAMGGHNGEYRVKSFLGNFGSKVFLANSCVETNRYASDLFGEADFTDSSISVSVASDSFSHSQSVSVKLLKLVRPEEFVSLKTGGPLNNHKCEGYWHRQGDPLFNNRNYKKITFNQQ